MTVREAVCVLRTADTICLGYGANAVPFDKNDALVLEAYGNFVVLTLKVIQHLLKNG